MKPAISVIIPCYNDGIYLKETIAKLKLQTFRDFEIIIIDDGSTDEYTLNVFEEIKEQNLTIYHKPNGRMAAARNYGIERAKADIIVALDSDDYFEKSFFEKALNVLKTEENVAVVSSYIKSFGLRKNLFKARGGTVENFLFSNQCVACTMFRKSVWVEVGKYDEQMKLGFEDWEFYIRVTEKGYLIKIIPEILFFYRQTEKSTLKNHSMPNQKEILEYMINKHDSLYKEKLIELIMNKQVLYTESRISWQNILKMIKDRLSGTYK